MADSTDNPSYQSSLYEAQLDDLIIVSDCYAGSSAVKEKHNEYLPKEPAEKDDNYSDRVRRSEFYEVFRSTVDDLTGMVFRKPPMIGEDMPPELVEHAEDIDLAGNHFNVFANDLLTAANRDGHVSILIDMPPKITDEMPFATRTDERMAGMRAYWVKVEKSQIINWQWIDDRGKIKLTLVTIKEHKTVQSGRFTESAIVQYRVLEPGKWELWQEVDDDVVMIDSGETFLDFIPLVTIYADRTGVLQSRPPLLGLARENLRHFRLTSDRDNIAHVCCVPMLVAVGRSNTKEPLNVGPYAVTDVNEGGDLKYVEHSGKAIGEVNNQIKESEDRMSVLGLRMLSNVPQVKATATEAILDFNADANVLVQIVNAVQDGCEQAFKIHAIYTGLEDGGSVTFNRDFAKFNIDPQKITAYNMMVKDGNLRRETLWSILQRADELPDDFDATAEAAALDKMDEATQLAVERQRLSLERDRAANNFMNDNEPTGVN